MPPERRLDSETEQPATLHRVIQTMIGEGLKERYPPPQKLSHELFVLLMQINEQSRRHKPAAAAGPGLDPRGTGNGGKAGAGSAGRVSRLTA
jgi:hypothetical protein